MPRPALTNRQRAMIKENRLQRGTLKGAALIASRLGNSHARLPEASPRANVTGFASMKREAPKARSNAGLPVYDDKKPPCSKGGKRAPRRFKTKGDEVFCNRYDWDKGRWK